MKKNEAISILATSARPREPKNRKRYDEAVKMAIEALQPERKKCEWTTEEVAELLSNLFGDECACNFNGIDEWLPERCKYAEIADECPNPKEKHGCWMQFLLQGGAEMVQD